MRQLWISLLLCSLLGQLHAQVQYQVLNIPARQPLKQLAQLANPLRIDMVPNEIRGPGDNNSNADPYVLYTGRVYNNSITLGQIRIKQGTTFRLRACNGMDAYVDTFDNTTNAQFGVLEPPQMASGNNGFKDANVLAQHFHGLYGNPGTENIACDPLPSDGSPCLRGDNVFNSIVPGSCAEYQYDVPSVHSPGTYWIHPHHHGSASNQVPTASFPAIIEHNPEGGFDFLSPSSCAWAKSLLASAPEIILHFQSIMLAYNLDGYTASAAPTGELSGPVDDAMIITAADGTPQDPYCCKGPHILDDGAGSWDTVGDENGSAVGDMISKQPFYSSGPDAEFTLINGGYQPVVDVQANTIYNMRMIQASSMKWLDLTFDRPGCSIYINSRDGIYLNSFPRPADHLVMVSANRIDSFLICTQPGTYTLRTGAGPFDNDPECQSSHCQLRRQPVLATFVVAASVQLPAVDVATVGQCTPVFPPYLADLRDQQYVQTRTNVTVTGLMNFSNPDTASPGSAACAINGLLYTESVPLQESIGTLTELKLHEVSVHPFHHHIQPFQIVDLPGQHNVSNGGWQIGDWADTLFLPNLANDAVVRWIPGPVEITGTGYYVLHCHLLPHNDEGCMMKIQLLEPRWVPFPDNGLSRGGAAGVTLAGIAVVAAAITGTVLYTRRAKARRRAQKRAAEGLMRNVHDPAAVEQAAAV